MDVMELIYLLTGVGLGFLGSRLIRSPKEPVNNTAESLNQDAPQTQDTLQEDKPPLEGKIVKSEPQEDAQDKLSTLQEELQQTQMAYEMAKHMSQFKAGFLARTSHELRSPLSSLMGMHQLILSDLCDSPEEERDFLAQANTSAQKMVKLLDEVIAVAKTEHGTNSLDNQPVELNKVFDEVDDLTYLQAANRNLQLEIISPESKIYVSADPRRFKQALLALVDTAISQMEDGSIKVWATLSPQAEEVYIWIDIQAPNPVWSEAVDTLSTTPEVEESTAKTTTISPGLNFLMAQTLIETMQGNLQAVPVSEEDRSSNAASDHNLTRLQYSMPLTTLETVDS
ncbi:MAG: HAMP domain-containing histidine kinase [Symploca sp. SIO1C2]|nr:HAMP domain-containing histidine kinase [Symploca sp. SIO1C2]